MVSLGVFLHAVGGVAAGGVYTPCKKVKVELRLARHLTGLKSVSILPMSEDRI